MNMQAGRQGTVHPAAFAAGPYGPGAGYGGVIGNQGQGYPPGYRNEQEYQGAASGAYAAGGYGAPPAAAYQAAEIPPPGVPGSGYREWYPVRGPFDPCPAITVKTYVVPPNQFIAYQPMGLPQYPLEEALRLGTLWPALYSPYESRCGRS